MTKRAKLALAYIAEHEPTPGPATLEGTSPLPQLRALQKSGLTTWDWKVICEGGRMGGYRLTDAGRAAAANL